MASSLGPETTTEAAKYPSHVELHGRYTSLKPLNESYAPGLFKHIGGPENMSQWAYMTVGGFTDLEGFRNTIAIWSKSQDPLYFVVFSGPQSDAASEPIGIIAYLSIVPAHRRIEIGYVIFGDKLKRTRAATEASYLIIKHAFDQLGNSRVEWRANSLNQPSLSAAKRLGFTYEGNFRKHMVIKGRRRDSVWLSIIDDEWPSIRNALDDWLNEQNFDTSGQQIRTLAQCRESENSSN